MRIKIKKGNLVLEVEDDVKRDSYPMNSGSDVINRTLSLTKQVIDEFIRLDGESEKID